MISDMLSRLPRCDASSRVPDGREVGLRIAEHDIVLLPENSEEGPMVATALAFAFDEISDLLQATLNPLREFPFTWGV
jgi:hypothetical protein